MPVYTYRCESCGVQFEQTQKFADAPLTRCPECGKKQLRKVYTPVGIVFKGSGFYATDHRSPSGMNWGSGEKEAEKSSSESKSSNEDKPALESKPAAEPKASTESTPAKSSTSSSEKKD